MEEGISLGEVGPMAGMPWSQEDLDMLKKLGILPDGIPKEVQASPGSQTLGGGPMDWGKVRGTTSGSGPGTTAGAGAGLGALDMGNSNSGSSSATSFGASAGITSEGQRPHHVERESRVGATPQAPKAGVFRMESFLLPSDPRLSALPQQEVFAPYIKPTYRLGNNPWTDQANRSSNAQMARNYLEHMIRSRS